jgi:glycosyltransferase involved in cell wall biosynthesis
MPEADEPRLTILTVIAPHRFSGAERIATYLADSLQQRGHRVVFACKAQEDFLQELERRNLECLSTRISGKANPASLWRVASIARSIGADLIHTHLSTGAWWGSFAGRLLGIPVLAHVHALNTKTCFVHADMIAACSEGVKRHLVAQGVSADRIRVIYNGIAPPLPDDLRPLPDVRGDLGLTDGEPVIGVAAHLSPKKGQRYVIEAAALLRRKRPTLRCYLVGEGQQRAELEDLVERLGVGDQVRFMGYRRDAVDLMQAMDIVILPSVAKEGLGVCLVEAGALAKPVIGSDIPGIDEIIVEGRTGLLVAPADASGLAAAIDGLLEDRELRASMGAAGRQRVLDRFTLEQMVDRTERLYREIIGANARSRGRPAVPSH